MAYTLAVTVAVVLMSLGFTNGQNANQCIVCNSLTNPDCLFRPELLQPQDCAGVPVATFASCFTRVNNDGNTERGCLNVGADTNACQASANCTNCINTAGTAAFPLDSCNRHLVAPLNRVRCHTCHGSRFGRCGTQLPLNETLLCPQFIQNEQRCFTRRSERFITRGCFSNTTFCADNAECLFCEGTGCNGLVHTNPSIPLASAAVLLSVAPFLVLGVAATAAMKQIKF